jgi:hypothetical protein
MPMFYGERDAERKKTMINKDVYLPPEQIAELKKRLLPPLYRYREIQLRPKSIDTLNLNVETWADIDKQTYFCWGDYWAKRKLQEAFEGFGVNCNVHKDHADVTVYLFGSPYWKSREVWPWGYNPKSYNIVWVYSHPTKVTKEEMARYDLVMCLSEIFLPELQKIHSNVIMDPLISCTDMRPPEDWDGKYKRDVVFLGNARGAFSFGRQGVFWLDPDPEWKIEVYGHKWFLQTYKYMHPWLCGQYWEYEKLPELYASSKIVLVDGHEDMQNLGFVPMKIFDVLASGGFPLVHYNNGVEDIFGDSVVMYKSKTEMNACIRKYLRDDDARLEKIAAGQIIANEHTYDKRAKQILNAYSQATSRKDHSVHIQNTPKNNFKPIVNYKVLRKVNKDYK